MTNPQRLPATDIPSTSKKRKAPLQIIPIRNSRVDRRSRLLPLLHPDHAQTSSHISSKTTVNLDGTHTTVSTFTPPPTLQGLGNTPLLNQINPILTNPLRFQHPSTPQTMPNPPLTFTDNILDLGLPTYICKYCGAYFWIHEALKKTRKSQNPEYSMCCQLGAVDLPLLPETPPLLDRLLDINGDAMSKHYRTHIRSYNAAFSWTSFGAKFDPRLLNSRGPYSLVLSGENYHYMGSLLPPEGRPPRYSQLYVHDPTSEVTNRMSSVRGEAHKLNANLMAALQDMIDNYNVLAKSFRRVRDALREPTNHNLRLRIAGTRVEHNRMYELPTGTELAGLIPGDFSPTHDDRDIIVNNRATGLCRITSLNPLFDSLHFPMLFPHGNDGYHNRIRYNPLHRDPLKKRKYVTQREYYCFRLQYRQGEGKTLIRSGKALQHFCIDAFTTIEQNRLTYLRLNQKKLRSDLYKGLYDALNRGDLDSRNIGHVINPSSFTGGVRYMQQLYQDAIAICRHYKNPDLFITFTCNAQWPEIVNAFKADVGVHGEDKPMVIARVFRMRLELLKEDLQKGHFFGRSIADMHTVEFQKRGLPHVHIILWLADECKPKTIDMVDKIISAELPDPLIDPIGYDAVTKFMIHGPCGESKPSSPCMKNGRCSKFFPKQFASKTTFDPNGYVTYRRRETRVTVQKSNATLDNRYVVPYNRDLLVKYQAHINVEICHKGQLIKYLFKYITKGPDRSEVTAENASSREDPNRPIDEISQYLDCRSLSSYEAVWRLFSFKIHERSTPVFRLCVHLPEQHQVTFTENQSISAVVNRPDVEKTMLTEWFTLNRTYPSARQFTYADIPQNFIWDKQCSQWVPRKQGFVIGRIASVPPQANDVFYLRLLLTKIPGAISFQDLRTVNGILYNDYRQACQALGLLATDDEWNDVMAEVSRWGMPPVIRTTFVSLLMFCHVTSPTQLFDQWWPSMADDFRHRLAQNTNGPLDGSGVNDLRNQVLQSLQTLLHNYCSSLSHFRLPLPTSTTSIHRADDLVSQHLEFDILVEQTNYQRTRASLNTHQQKAHDAILQSLLSNSGKLFFLYGHGGTGKTYLYNCIISRVRSLGQIAIVVASSGIAATLLPGGITAHSQFKIPIEVDHASTCAVKKGTTLARLLELATLIVWDEAPMVHKHSFEAVDRTLCDIMNTPTDGPNYKPFGGKTVILGGDFRQTLPVITNGTRGDNIEASLTRSYLWHYCTLLQLHTNMRVTPSPSTRETPPSFAGMQFSDWLLAIGDGRIAPERMANPTSSDWIRIPDCFIVPQSTDPIKDLINRVYPDLVNNYHNVAYIRSRAIVAPTNDVVTEINDYIIDRLPGEQHVYLSSDTLTSPGTDQAALEIEYPTEFLNGLSYNGMPEHRLRFKQYSIVMLLRNLNPAAGLCNGTRILITHLGTNVIRGLIVGGTFEGTIAVIPRIVLDKTDPRWPFTLKRRQYPLRLCYGMTINKSQGQTLDQIGIFLPAPVFSHGQLYVALSRVRSAAGIHIVLQNNSETEHNCTRNIVYEEIFQDLQTDVASHTNA
ncbi:ATP-dependent DNA helicase PIF1 [Linum grandiflorum]